MNQENYERLQQVVTEATQTPQERQQALETEQMLALLQQRRITPSTELPQMDFLFKLFHKPCFPRGDW